MKIAAQAVVLLIVAGGIAAVDCNLRPPQLTLKVSAPTPPAPVQPAPTQPDQPAPRNPQQAPAAQELGAEITLAQAKAQFDAGTTFIDARLQHEYVEGHIRFALHIDSNELGSPEATQALSKLDPSQRLIVYCGGGDCHASHNLAIYLQQAGYSDIHIFKDGYPAWTTAGYDINTGEQP